jgi:hypothetical protein
MIRLATPGTHPLVRNPYIKSRLASAKPSKRSEATDQRDKGRGCELGSSAVRGSSGRSGMVCTPRKGRVLKSRKNLRASFTYRRTLSSSSTSGQSTVAAEAGLLKCAEPPSHEGRSGRCPWAVAQECVQGRAGIRLSPGDPPARRCSLTPPAGCRQDSTALLIRYARDTSSASSDGRCPDAPTAALASADTQPPTQSSDFWPVSIGARPGPPERIPIHRPVVRPVSWRYNHPLFHGKTALERPQEVAHAGRRAG